MIALEEKIKNMEARVGVVGLGYVGLPLAVEFAKKGFHVIGIEPDKDRIIMLNCGKSYISDVLDQDIDNVTAAGRFKVSENYGDLEQADAIILCVPTPLDKNKQPDISFVIYAADSVSKIMKEGQLVVLESTTYPGTTDEVVKPRLERSGLKAGKEFFLAFSPERVDPGNKTFKLSNIPKIVGGINSASTYLSALLYRQIVKEVHEVSSPAVAEMEKLLENIFRSVNIALVNEMAILCRKMGIDIWEVIDAAKTKPYGFMPFYPGPGIGGHCIPLDPFYLSWKAKEYGINTHFIELAGEINDRMPEHVVELVNDALNQDGKSLKSSKVLVLGAAYKKDISDVRESPSLKIIALLMNKKACVEYNDPYVPQLSINGNLFRSVDISPEYLKGTDCVVIVTDHSSYDYPGIIEHSKLIVDSRNATKNVLHNSARIVRL